MRDPGGSTTRGSGLWHSGRPDLIQRVPKLLVPCRNVIIDLWSRPFSLLIDEASDTDRS